MFIRKFIQGTFVDDNKVLSDIIIKRRLNVTYIIFYIMPPQRRAPLAMQRAYFLVGYTEELLSIILKCPVKLEIQAADEDDVTHRLLRG